MKRILAGMAIIGTMIITGCTSPPTDSDVSVIKLNLEDGRLVNCALYDSGSYAGGITCDWENAE